MNRRQTGASPDARAEAKLLGQTGHHDGADALRATSDAAGLADHPAPARLFVVSTALLGLTAVSLAVVHQPPSAQVRTFLFVLLAVFAGLVKVRLPVVGSLSLAYAFVLATLMGFGLGASALAGLLTALASGLVPGPNGRRPVFHRTCFNAGVIGLAASVSGFVYVAIGGQVGLVELPRGLLPVVAYTVVFSAVNIGLIAAAIGLTGQDEIAHSLWTNYLWSVPGYMAGSSVSTVLVLLEAHENPALLLLGAPFIYLVHLTYRTRNEQTEEAIRHSQQTAELYLGVTQALARAVEAKDECTEDHLQRVQQYCAGIGETLGLSAPEMEALRAASVLHDIGKIAVPEYVLTKPGRLTPEETELMKIHPKVGAKILSAVPFPYPLAPVVRHHHERWDGTGYPDGIAGTEIPLGARILTAVDCYDALTTDRPYRKALPREEALGFLRDQSGRMFDPQIVRLLVDNIDALERRVTEAAALSPPESFSPIAVEDRTKPDPLEASKKATAPSTAADEVIVELTRLAQRLHWQADVIESLEQFSERLADVVPFKTFVLYIFDDERRHLRVGFATGQAVDALRDLVIPVGERLSGWAALHQRPYRGRAHDNPLQRDGSRFDLEDLPRIAEIADLRSAVVAPLSSEAEHLGVIALYHGSEFEYDDAHVAALTRIAGEIARALPSPVPWPAVTPSVVRVPSGSI